jgi:hypothetical protein
MPDYCRGGVLLTSPDVVSGTRAAHLWISRPDHSIIFLVLSVRFALMEYVVNIASRILKDILQALPKCHAIIYGANLVNQAIHALNIAIDFEDLKVDRIPQ